MHCDCVLLQCKKRLLPLKRMTDFQFLIQHYNINIGLAQQYIKSVLLLLKIYVHGIVK